MTVTRCVDVNRKKVVFLLTSVLLSCNLKTKVLADVHMADMCGIKPVFMETSNFTTGSTQMESASVLSWERFSVGTDY